MGGGEEKMKREKKIRKREGKKKTIQVIFSDDLYEVLI